MTTYPTTQYHTTKKKFTETRRATRSIQEEGEEPVIIGTRRGSRERTVSVQKKGPYTEAEIDGYLESSDSRNASGVGTVISSDAPRANAAGMYYVNVTTETYGTWTWVDE